MMFVLGVGAVLMLAMSVICFLAAVDENGPAPVITGVGFAFMTLTLAYCAGRLSAVAS